MPVETPAAGSPKVAREVKPGPYPSSPREAWRPARAIPGRKGKAEALRQFLDAWRRQEEALREIMRPDAAAMLAWLGRGGVLAA